MPLPKQLFAVVSHVRPEPATAPALRPHRNLVELQRQKLDELKAKKSIDRANALLDRLETRQAAIKSEIEALQRRQRCCCERAERISDRIIAELEAAALTRADGFRSAVLILPSPAAVEILDLALIPSEYFRTPKPPAKVPDKAKIRTAIEAGAKVAGCKLVQGVTLRRS